MPDASGSELGSAVFISDDQVVPSGSGVLDGWSFAVKDNIDVAGVRTTGGTRYLSGHIAHADSSVALRLREAGARIVGKTNLHELGHGITGINPTFGTTLHPDNSAFTVGGSSGGSALAVALGRARAALGTDTGGSVRIPAAYTGLVGYRPGRGRYPTDGVLQISTTRDTVGVIARTVADVSLVDEVLSRASGAKGDLRRSAIGVLQENTEALSPPLRLVFERAIEAMEAKGVTVRHLDESRDLERQFTLGIVVLNYETIRTIDAYLTQAGVPGGIDALVECSESPDIREILRSALDHPVSTAEYQSALRELKVLHRTFRERLEAMDIDMIAYPTASSEPPRAAGREDVDAVSELRNTVLNATPATLAGTPAISIPSGRSEATGLPVGMTLEHVGGDDAALLKTAARVEPIIAEESAGNSS